MTYASANSAWDAALDLLKTKGQVTQSRDGECTEVVAETFKFPSAFRCMSSSRRVMSPIYAAAEFLWYLSGRDSIEMIKAYAPSYERYANDGIAWGAYGARWLTTSAGMVQERTRWARVMDGGAASSWKKHEAQRVIDKFEKLGLDASKDFTQFMCALVLLETSPLTRQCVMTCYDSGDLLHAFAADKGDIPCTLTLQFFRRNSALDLVVTMRSNDVWRGMPYDFYAFTGLQRLLAWILGDKPGVYCHNVGSLHVYTRDAGKVRPSESSSDETSDDLVDPYAAFRLPGDSFRARLTAMRGQIDKCLAWESNFREKRWTRVDIKSLEFEIACPLLRDAFLSAVHKWCAVDPEWIVDPGIRRLMTNVDTRGT